MLFSSCCRRARCEASPRLKCRCGCRCSFVGASIFEAHLNTTSASWRAARSACQQPPIASLCCFRTYYISPRKRYRHCPPLVYTFLRYSVCFRSSLSFLYVTVDYFPGIAFEKQVWIPQAPPRFGLRSVFSFKTVCYLILFLISVSSLDRLRLQDRLTIARDSYRSNMAPQEKSQLKRGRVCVPTILL